MSTDITSIFKDYANRIQSDLLVIKIPLGIISFTQDGRVSRIGDLGKKIISSNDDDEKKRNLNALTKNLQTPNLLFYGGVGYKQSSLVSLSVIDQMIDAEVQERLIRERITDKFGAGMKVIMKIQKTLMNSIGLSSFGIEQDIFEDNINFVDIADSGINFAMSKDGKVLALKVVKRFRIRVDSEDMMKCGVWEFPSCVIAVESFMSKDQLKFKNEPVIIYPHPYIHPFVFEDTGKICTNIESLSEIVPSRLPFLNRIFEYFLIVENILVNGYHENVVPANGHLWCEKYNDFKIYPSIDEEEKDEKKKILENIKKKFDLYRVRSRERAKESDIDNLLNLEDFD